MLRERSGRFRVRIFLFLLLPRLVLEDRGRSDNTPGATFSLSSVSQSLLTPGITGPLLLPSSSLQLDICLVAAKEADGDFVSLTTESCRNPVTPSDEARAKNDSRQGPGT